MRLLKRAVMGLSTNMTIPGGLQQPCRPLKCTGFAAGSWLSMRTPPVFARGCLLAHVHGVQNLELLPPET